MGILSESAVMIGIEVVDFKGDRWYLSFPEVLDEETKYTQTIWVAAPKRPASLHHYEIIPIPIFMEWWL
jgi:hypothetical protein